MFRGRVSGLQSGLGSVYEVVHGDRFSVILPPRKLACVFYVRTFRRNVLLGLGCRLRLGIVFWVRVSVRDNGRPASETI